MGLCCAFLYVLSDSVRLSGTSEILPTVFEIVMAMVALTFPCEIIARLEWYMRLAIVSIAREEGGGRRESCAFHAILAFAPLSPFPTLTIILRRSLPFTLKVFTIARTGTPLETALAGHPASFTASIEQSPGYMEALRSAPTFNTDGRDVYMQNGADAGHAAALAATGADPAVSAAAAAAARDAEVLNASGPVHGGSGKVVQCPLCRQRSRGDSAILGIKGIEKTVCCVCLEADADVALPCGHICLCQVCFVKIAEGNRQTGSGTQPRPQQATARPGGNSGGGGGGGSGGGGGGRASTGVARAPAEERPRPRDPDYLMADGRTEIGIDLGDGRGRSFMGPPGRRHLIRPFRSSSPVRNRPGSATVTAESDEDEGA